MPMSVESRTQTTLRELQRRDEGPSMTKYTKKAWAHHQVITLLFIS